MDLMTTPSGMGSTHAFAGMWVDERYVIDFYLCAVAVPVSSSGWGWD
jgi:hypothetical protein